MFEWWVRHRSSSSARARKNWARSTSNFNCLRSTNLTQSTNIDGNLVPETSDMVTQTLQGCWGENLFPDRLDLIVVEFVLGEKLDCMLDVRRPDELVTIKICWSKKMAERNQDSKWLEQLCTVKAFAPLYRLSRVWISAGVKNFGCPGLKMKACEKVVGSNRVARKIFFSVRSTFNFVNLKILIG